MEPMKPEVELSLNEVAACAVEIIRNLSLAEGAESWDFHFGPKGLYVSAKKLKSAISVTPQEDLDFDVMSAQFIQ